MSAADLSAQYQQKTEREHILHAPDTYIGSVENVLAEMDLYDPTTGKIAPKTLQYNAGLVKLFDEAIVNARDHVIRMIKSDAPNKRLVGEIEVSAEADGTISIYNTGNGIDVAKHPETDLWIPEMIFGHLRTSTNYNKQEKKIVGGKNGFGFKLVLIWSTYGRIETLDHIRQLHYTQEFHSNLDRIDPPTITKAAKTAKPFTRVVFRPDYARLAIPAGLSPEMVALFQRRAYDVSAITHVKVSFNSVPVPVKNFRQYVELYLPAAAGGDATETASVVSGAASEVAASAAAAASKKAPPNMAYETPHERWEYAIALSPHHEFKQVSFVNGIATFKGGKHVDYIMGQITRKICDLIETKKKVKVPPQSIREQLMLFLRCDVENPSFESQSKDYLSTPASKFGSACEVSDAFIKRIMAMGVAEVAMSVSQIREDSKVAKKANGVKTKTLRGIEKLDDAIWAGGPRSAECTLILCEGDSAKAGIISGLTKADRNTIGIFPLKGKLLNVKDQTAKRIAENKEIADIIKIMGLEIGRAYSPDDMRRCLRYGKIMNMCDQDADGSHIKGLCINLFESQWRSLFEITGFLSFMNTPILRATRGAQTQVFYSLQEYDAWRKAIGEAAAKAWNLKYFKGLGTSTAKEFKEYMANRRVIDYAYSGPKSHEMMDTMFNENRADDRKHLLMNVYDPGLYLDKTQPQVAYEDFVVNELLHFSTYDCSRSIPHLVDGLKTSIRKILFSCFKRDLTKEIKVAQLSGYVSEHAEYHHGEQSLNGAIVGMAQTFVGANNINLLEPSGQFGTRLLGGKDSASERYIFTFLNPLTRRMFPKADEAVLRFLEEDGSKIEPDYYAPILPFVLVNGVSGIGTGFSCKIPAFSPAEIVADLRRRLTGGEAAAEWTPYYEGFKGTIVPIQEHRYLVRGCYEKTGPNSIRITEIPVGTWTTPYKSFLEELCEPTDKAGKKMPAVIRNVVSYCTDTDIEFIVDLPEGRLEEWEAQRHKAGDDTVINGVEKHLKLTATLSTTNIHLFDKSGKLRKYDSIRDVVDAYMPVRLELYEARKQAQLTAMEADFVRQSNRARWIREILDDVVDLRRKTNAEVVALLRTRDYAECGGDYKYLTKMPMDAVSVENHAAIEREKVQIQEELETLRGKTASAIWLQELEEFAAAYEEYRRGRATPAAAAAVAEPAKKKLIRKPAASAAAK